MKKIAKSSTFNPRCTSKFFMLNRGRIPVPDGFVCKACLKPIRGPFFDCSQWPPLIHVRLLSNSSIDGVTEFDSHWSLTQYYGNFGQHDHGFFNAPCFNHQPGKFFPHLVINTGTLYCEYRIDGNPPTFSNGMIVELQKDGLASMSTCPDHFLIQITWDL